MCKDPEAGGAGALLRNCRKASQAAAEDEVVWDGRRVTSCRTLQVQWGFQSLPYRSTGNESLDRRADDGRLSQVTNAACTSLEGEQ